jgi:hypothetical protein
MQHLAIFWLLTIWWKYAGNVIGLVNTFYFIFHTIVYFQKISVLSIDTMKYNEQQHCILCDMHIPVQIWMMMTRNHIQSFYMLFFILSTRNSQIFSICVSHFVASSPEKSANIADVYCLLLHLTHPIQCKFFFLRLYSNAFIWRI